MQQRIINTWYMKKQGTYIQANNRISQQDIEDIINIK
jgi:predicted transcriptional regulator